MKLNGICRYASKRIDRSILIRCFASSCGEVRDGNTFFQHPETPEVEYERYATACEQPSTSCHMDSHTLNVH